MPNQKKKHYSADFKAQVVKEILKEEKTISQLSAEYGIHSSQLHKWRDHVLAGLPNLFNEQAEKNLREKEAEWQEEYSILLCVLSRPLHFPLTRHKEGCFERRCTVEAKNGSVFSLE
jgi:transposase-like protein